MLEDMDDLTPHDPGRQIISYCPESHVIRLHFAKRVIALTPENIEEIFRCCHELTE